jgi:hypothetical protein
MESSRLLPRICCLQWQSDESRNVICGFPIPFCACITISSLYRQVQHNFSFPSSITNTATCFGRTWRPSSGKIQFTGKSLKAEDSLSYVTIIGNNKPIHFFDFYIFTYFKRKFHCNLILLQCKKGRPPLLLFFLEIVFCLKMEALCTRNM